MKEEEVFTRGFLAAVLVTTSFFSWGRWVAFTVGLLFLLSATQGICLACELYKAWKPLGKKNTAAGEELPEKKNHAR
jgi:hypothetical protein